eukprot:2319485-Rhodomonas_salina.1
MPHTFHASVSDHNTLSVSQHICLGPRTLNASGTRDENLGVPRVFYLVVRVVRGDADEVEEVGAVVGADDALGLDRDADLRSQRHKRMPTSMSRRCRHSKDTTRVCVW